MNHPNPFIPQGSVLEQNKRRSRMKLAVFLSLAVGVCGLTAMLIQGCKREQTTENPPTPEANNMPTETNSNTAPMEGSSNAVALPPMQSSNAAPVVPTPPVTPPEAAGSQYTVVKGDTLGKIAKAQGVTLKALEAANPDVQPTKLKVGQKLTLPAGGTAPTATGAGTGAETANATAAGGETYTVKAGDTLSKIARSHGTTV